MSFTAQNAPCVDESSTALHDSMRRPECTRTGVERTRASARKFLPHLGNIVPFLDGVLTEFRGGRGPSYIFVIAPCAWPTFQRHTGVGENRLPPRNS